MAREYYNKNNSKVVYKGFCSDFQNLAFLIIIFEKLWLL